MAIGSIHLSWMRRLAERGCFQGLSSVIDLGPQDIQLERAALDLAARTFTTAETRTRLLDRLYPNGRVDPDGQPAFYELFGLGPYSSIDVDDRRATYQINLNEPVSGLPEFDVVTNYGTTEHVFNIGEAFRTIHQLTKPGGLSLHCVPAFGFINHGFYTINPNVFAEMARANGYDVIDFSYYDNAFVRNVELARDGLDGFDLASLPIKLADMENSQYFMTKVVDLFYRNLMAENTRRAIAGLDPSGPTWRSSNYPDRNFHICFVFDLIFFAMRRPAERRPFVMPIQNASGVPPIKCFFEGDAGLPPAPVAARSSTTRTFLKRALPPAALEQLKRVRDAIRRF